MARRTVRSILAGVVVCAVVAACTGGDDETPESTLVTTTSMPEPPRVLDEVLTIGALVPQSEALLGPSMTEAVTQAVAAINDAGGVLDRNVRLVIEDEGATTAAAADGVTALVEQDVDAIVGPSSSITSVTALERSVAARVVSCSATATSIALDNYPDDGLFFRTIAGDSLQAIALAELAEETGARSIAVVHVDDAYGRPYADATIDALELRALDVVAVIPLPVDAETFDEQARELVGSDAQVAVVLGSATASTRFLDALNTRDNSGLRRIVVNDTVRDPDSQPVLATLEDDLRERIRGAAPQVIVSDETDDVDPLPFSAQVVDCVNLTALAALQAQSDSPSVIASQIPSVSSGGSRCRTFEVCAERLDQGLEIDYDGPSGITDVGRDGDTSEARFDIFSISPDGADEFTRELTASR